MVIHQPRYSIFASMDNVIFLGPGGRTVYSGSPLDANDYFEMLGFYAAPNINVADYFMDVIGGSIPRNNDNEFKPSDLFVFWNHWVDQMNQYSFSLEDENDPNGDNAAADEKESNRDKFVLTPKQLNILRKLFIESVVMSVDVNYMETIHESGSGNSPALTSQKALSEFMRLVSVVSSSLFSNHQIIGIGLAVRVLFHQNHSGKSMKLSMHQNSFSTMRTNSRGSVGSDRGSPRSSSPVPVSSGTSGTSGEGSGVEMSTSGAALSSGHMSLSSNESGNSGILEWSDLSFALSDANVLYDLVSLRTAELVGGGSSSSTFDDTPNVKAAQPNGEIAARPFGWDHKGAQCLLFSTRYCLKRKRGMFDWFGELVLYAGGAGLIGGMNGLHTLESFTGSGMAPQYLNLIMIFGILATISSLPSFGSEKLIFYRESSTGISIVAFWFARCVIDLFYLGIQCLVWGALLDDLIEPEMNTNVFVTFFFFQGFANSGMGYLLATLIPARNLTLYAALFAALGGFFLSGVNNDILLSAKRIAALGGNEIFGGIIKAGGFGDRFILGVMEINYSKHILQALITSDIMQLRPGKALIVATAQLNGIGYASLDVIANETVQYYIQPQLSYDKGNLMPDPDMRDLKHSIFGPIYSLIWIGIVGRLLALVGLFLMDRPQQNKTKCTKLCCNVMMLPCRLFSRGCKSKTTTKKPIDHLVVAIETLGTDLEKNVTNDGGGHSNEEVVVNPLGAVRSSIDPVAGEQLSKLMASNTKNQSQSTTKKRNKRRSTLDLATGGGFGNTTTETWLQRIAGLGMSSRVRLRKKKEQMALMFELLDRLGEGVIDPDDMQSFSKKYKKKVHVVFGDETGWKRVKNVGLFSHQNFEQFFDWFVLTPTVDSICAAVVQGNKAKSKQIMKKKEIKQQESRDRRERANTARGRANTGGGGGDTFPNYSNASGGSTVETKTKTKTKSIDLHPTYSTASTPKPGHLKSKPSWVGRQNRLQVLKTKRNVTRQNSSE